MRLVLATNHLGLGGSESYLLTVAEQLQRLGHDPLLYAPEMGLGAVVARQRGIPLCDEADLPDEFDAALVQDAAVSYEVADHRPQAPQVFVAHSEIFDLQSPPQIGDSVQVVVALNDRIAAKMRTLAAAREVKRLRQPIDTERFSPRSPLPPRPKRALFLSNTPHSDRVEMIDSACSAAGIELLRLGGVEGQTIDPRNALHEVEVVIGYGRSILEAMACGRAAYVYDWNGGDGWVTAASYARIEADGIAGRNSETAIDEDRLSSDLRDYSPSMGSVNHDLVIAHHRANVHAQELVELFRGLGAPSTPHREAPLQEMARLVRLEWRARADSHSLLRQNVSLNQELARSEAKVREAQASAKQSHERAKLFESTMSWRLTKPLRALGRLLRRFRAGSAA